MMAPMDLLGLSKQEAYDRAKGLLETVGLADKALSWPSEPTGRQRQRVGRPTTCGPPSPSAKP